MKIRPVLNDDYDAIWELINPIIKRGDSYAIPVDIGKEDALEYWIDKPEGCYCIELDGVIVGTYYLKANSMGPANHVCNCGYVVREGVRGRGLASAMCEHSQVEAVRLGFKAMQFNLVVSTNKGAIRLWRKLGFEIVGTLPKSYNHPEEGFIDSYVMYKWLEA